MSNTGRTGTPEESLKILVVDDEPAMVGRAGRAAGPGWPPHRGRL